MKHSSILEEAGLIVTCKQERFKHHHLNALPLQEAIDRRIKPMLDKAPCTLKATGWMWWARVLSGLKSYPKTGTDMQFGHEEATA